MKLRRIFSVLISALLFIGAGSAFADTTLTSREEQVATFNAKYDPQFDAVLVKFTAAKKRLAFDASSSALIKNSIANLTETRRVIEQNLADPNAPMANVIRLADEQLGMFSLTNFKLDNLMAKVKTVTCVKGKTVKKISAIGTPKCPSGFKKK
jgi:hypothetical protein